MDLRLGGGDERLPAALAVQVQALGVPPADDVAHGSMVARPSREAKDRAPYRALEARSGPGRKDPCGSGRFLVGRNGCVTLCRCYA